LKALPKVVLGLLRQFRKRKKFCKDSIVDSLGNEDSNRAVSLKIKQSTTRMNLKVTSQTEVKCGPKAKKQAIESLRKSFQNDTYDPMTVRRCAAKRVPVSEDARQRMRGF